MATLICNIDRSGYPVLVLPVGGNLMNRFTGFTVLCAGLISLIMAETATAQAQAGPPHQVRREKSSIQQTAYYAAHRSEAYCEECQQHGHSAHYHSPSPAPVYYRQTHEPGMKGKISRHCSRTWNKIGRKWERWNSFWYQQDQVFKQRMLTQSVALFGEHEELQQPMVCDQCRHGIPHYLARNHVPQYPRDEPAIIQPTREMTVSQAKPVQQSIP
ncbi:MAG: hypothetical protein KDA65_19145, partial [Planctomycetaceae bacterium]|nr:hypothetical protein [Planctomycetaceae bacterium]